MYCNILPSVSVGHINQMKESYENTQFLLINIRDEEHKLQVLYDLKIVTTFLELHPVEVLLISGIGIAEIE